MIIGKIFSFLHIKDNTLTRTIFIALLTVLLILNINDARNTKQVLRKKLEVAEYNLKVANDSIRIVKDKAGKEEFEKLAFLTNSVENLAKLNQDLALEVKKIKGNTQTIIKGDVQIKEVPVPFVVKGELIDSNVIANFNYDTTYSPGNFRKLAGYTKYNLKDGTVVAKKTQDETGISFLTGIKDLDKGKPTIFLKSNYPGFQVTDLQGAELDPKLFQPKKKTPLVTPVVFLGWTPLQVESNNQVVSLKPQSFSAGLGIGFNLFKILGIKK